MKLGLLLPCKTINMCVFKCHFASHHETTSVILEQNIDLFCFIREESLFTCRTIEKVRRIYRRSLLGVIKTKAMEQSPSSEVSQESPLLYGTRMFITMIT
jgi:hypothetical protein